MITLLVGNHCVLELDGLANITNSPATFENTATVTVTLKDRQGVNVAGQAWPATMAYVTGSNGTYRATLDADLAIINGTHYVAVVDAQASGVLAHWEADVIAQTRRS